MAEQLLTVPIEHKLALTVQEACAYSNIGRNTLFELLKHPDCPFALRVGSKVLIKRKEFEQFISNNSRIQTFEV